MSLSRIALAVTLCLGAFTCPLSAQPTPETGNPLVTALEFAHRFGTLEALKPENDRRLKLKLLAAIGKSHDIPWESLHDVIDRKGVPPEFSESPKVSLAQMANANRAAVPDTRKRMNPKLRQQADLLSTQFDLIEEIHRKAAEPLVAWIVKNHRPGQPTGIVVVCSGNTRRSMLGATMGNVAANYHGFSDVRFFSGGLEPSAINPRTIAALREIGIGIEPTGKEAPRGHSEEANPILRVRFGEGHERIEFSKKYTDPHNPQSGFAAILVCSEADGACPNVRGADLRLPVPYLDPKAYDGAPFEAAKYAERRDDIGRFMLSVFLQARRRIDLAGPSK
jgi:arsenate reductase (thioredoxin)